MVGKQWMKWTLSEAVFKTGAKLLQKIVGQLGATLGHAYAATLVIGALQVVYAAARCLRDRPLGKITDAPKHILGSLFYGALFSAATIITFLIFAYGGDVGVNTLIVTLAIIPGAFIDFIFFGIALTGRKMLGLLFALAAGYIVVGAPPLAGLLSLPLWVQLSFAVMLILAVIQGVAKGLKEARHAALNFWGGLSTVLVSAGGLAWLGQLDILLDISASMQRFWLAAFGVGIFFIGAWAFNLLSYRYGAFIAFKGLILNGSYLAMAMVFGALFFGEPLTAFKISGALAYLCAFVLFDDKSWAMARVILPRRLLFFSNRELAEKLQKVKLLVTDFDGVLTDGFVYIDQDGKETVRCSRKDGLAIEMLKKFGITPYVISKTVNPVVTARCKTWNIKCWQGVADAGGKAEILKQIIAEHRLSGEEVAYIGDDLNDEAPIRLAGVSFTVADGHRHLRSIVDYVTKADGGEHAVREIVELILTAQEHNVRF